MKPKITFTFSTFVAAVTLVFVSGPMLVNQQTLAANAAQILDDPTGINGWHLEKLEN